MIPHLRVTFIPAASPRRCAQRSGTVGEEEGESEVTGGAKSSDPTTGVRETGQGDVGPPTTVAW